MYGLQTIVPPVPQVASALRLVPVHAVQMLCNLIQSHLSMLILFPVLFSPNHKSKA